MAIRSEVWTEEMIEVAGTRVQIVKGGSGEPLLILHDELGHPGWMRFHQGLAQHHTLHIPSHPGFGDSPRLDWIMDMRDLAGWYLQALEELGYERLNVMGFSFGGWLAAEMAAMCPHHFGKLVVVDAFGVRPPDGEIYDMFLSLAKEFLEDSFIAPETTEEFRKLCPEEPTPEQAEAWEVAREEACRLGWKPYMHHPSLPSLLRRVRGLPTLIVWGKQDPIVPVSAASVYRDSIDGSRLEVLEGCGHRPEIEKPDEFVGLVSEFLSEG